MNVIGTSGLGKRYGGTWRRPPTLTTATSGRPYRSGYADGRGRLVRRRGQPIVKPESLTLRIE
jgi:hypothetical protein